MNRGPLIPGVNEFDRPKKGIPRWLGVFLSLTVISLGIFTLWGFVAGGGPFSFLGEVEEQLQPTGYRPTVESNVIQVLVALPKEGACPTNTFDITATETPETITTAVNLIRPRSNSCPADQLTDEIWLDLTLTQPLDDRIITRNIDGQDLPQIR